MLLLDTCTLIWFGSSPEKLSEKAKNLLWAHAENLHVSIISAFEMGLKNRKKELNFSHSVREFFSQITHRYQMKKVNMDTEIAFLSSELPFIHKDPADRILIATAQIYKLTLLTPDPFIRQYPDVKVEW